MITDLLSIPDVIPHHSTEHILLFTSFVRFGCGSLPAVLYVILCSLSAAI